MIRLKHNTTLNNVTMCISSLNISGNTLLNNITTCISSLNVSGISTFSNKVGIGTTASTYVKLDVLHTYTKLIKYARFFICIFFIISTGLKQSSQPIQPLVIHLVIMIHSTAREQHLRLAICQLAQTMFAHIQHALRELAGLR
jgi:hypothetical protein